MQEATWLDLAHEAAARWPLQVARIELAARRENLVFRLIAVTGEHFALRVHRAGYRRPDELASELAWMQALAQGGMSVPIPLLSLDQHLLEAVHGKHVSVLSWLSGTPMGRSGTPLCIEHREATFHKLGCTLARLHALSDGWTPPTGFTRPQWSLDGLLGPEPLWGPFWEHPHLGAAQRRTLLHAREAATEALQHEMPSLDQGLIHADAVRENVLIDRERIQLIDFDDCAFGFRLFDIATALLRNRTEPDYPALTAALCEGYRSIRPLDTTQLDLFLMLRAFTYIGWIVPRLGEQGSDARSERFLTTGIELAETWLSSR